MRRRGDIPIGSLQDRLRIPPRGDTSRRLATIASRPCRIPADGANATRQCGPSGNAG